MRRLLLVVIAGTFAAYAQPLKPDMDVFVHRRQIFMAKMDSGSIAIFPSKPEAMRNLDVEYEYRQESNFYYLSGYEEPESILLLAPSNPRYKYVLFVRRRSPGAETYEGPRSGVEGAVRDFRADTAILIDDFERQIHRFLRGDNAVYYSFGVNPSTDAQIQQLIQERRSSDVRPIKDPTPILASMRLIKTDDDFRMGLRRAIDISAEAHIQACRAVHPGMYEYELQAVFEYTYRRNGSPRNGYPCIIGSGPDGTILHYDKNTRQMQDGDLVLMDCAAEYGYYSADITRTIPVNGKFTNEQKEIYQLVLDAQKAAMSRARPGVSFAALGETIDSVLGDGLVRFGFITKAKDFHLFSPHGYSHWIGLEVHDVGGYERNGKPITLELGMVFTVEPGLYVRPQILDEMKTRGYSEKEIEKIRRVTAPYMNIGVRIEDDILITPDGYTNLSAAAPREIADIESLMAASRGAGR